MLISVLGLGSGSGSGSGSVKTLPTTQSQETTQLAKCLVEISMCKADEVEVLVLRLCGRAVITSCALLNY